MLYLVDDRLQRAGGEGALACRGRHPGEQLLALELLAAAVALDDPDERGLYLLGSREVVFTVLALSAAAGASVGRVGVNDVAGFVTTARADHHGGASSGEELGGLALGLGSRALRGTTRQRRSSTEFGELVQGGASGGGMLGTNRGRSNRPLLLRGPPVCVNGSGRCVGGTWAGPTPKAATRQGRRAGRPDGSAQARASRLPGHPVS